MATPDFILTLREKIGHDPIPLLGVLAVVLDDQGQVLMGQRSDNKQWRLITGCVDPGEPPAVAAVREVEEETGVIVEADRLLTVESHNHETLHNGDQVWWTTISFRCRPIGGTAKVNDDESIDVRWCPLADVPPLPPHQSRAIALALQPNPDPWFAT